MDSAITSRLARLERRIETYRFALALLGFTAIAILTMAATHGNNARDEHITAKSISIQNEDGTTVLTLGSDEDGGLLQIASAEGKVLIAAYAAVSGDGELVLKSKNGIPTMLAGATPAREGLLKLFSSDGTKRVLIIGAEECGIMGLVDKEGSAELVATNRTSRPNPPVATSDTIESRIDGDFNGFGHDRIYKIANGQIWQQTSFDISVAVRMNPNVLIFKSGKVWKMRIEGDDRVITVERLK